MKKIKPKRQDIVYCKLMFKYIKYNSKTAFVAHLNIQYENYSLIPHYYNKQEINLNKEFEEEFKEFFKQENIKYFKMNNNTRYLNRYSLKLSEILQDLKFKQKIEVVNLLHIKYTKQYHTLNDALNELNSIFKNNTFAYEIITTDDLLNHI